MNSVKVRQAKIAQRRLKDLPKKQKENFYKHTRNNVDLEQVPGHETAKAVCDGLGDEGVKELIVALGIWLAAEDVTEFTPKF